MRRRPGVTEVVAFLVAALLVPRLEAQQAPASILGRWHGQSICVKAEWNAACHDEEVIYDVVSSTAGPDRVTVHAFKLVAGVVEPMGDIDFAPDFIPNQWSGEFSNARVHVRLSYIVAGDSLRGRMVDVPDGRPRRTMAAVRDSTAAP
jgi:hypothetical protein